MSNFVNSYLDDGVDSDCDRMEVVAAEKADLEVQINTTGDWNDDIEGQFKALVEDFKKTQTF